jgi:hypothetical protein
VVDGCFSCRSTSNQMQFCPVVGAMSDIEREKVLRSPKPSMTLTPSWNCGMAGHVQADCRDPRVETVVSNGGHAHSLIESPQTLLDVSIIPDSTDPMRVYCDLLAGRIHCTGALEPIEIPWSRRYGKPHWSMQRQTNPRQAGKVDKRQCTWLRMHVWSFSNTCCRLRL